MSHSQKQAVNICFCMQSLLVNWLFIIFLFKGKLLQCSRTLSLLIGYLSNFYQLAIYLQIGKISPVTVLLFCFVFFAEHHG